MPTLTAPKPHTLIIPSDLFSRIAEVAREQGQDPDIFAIKALSETVAEPAWKAKLRRSQEKSRQAFAASGMTDDELAEDIEAEIKAYRAERRALKAQS